MLTRRGKKSRLPTKREQKRARRAERARVSKLEASKDAKIEIEKKKTPKNQTQVPISVQSEIGTVLPLFEATTSVNTANILSELV